MATQRPALRASLSAFAARLLAEHEVAPRAQVIASEASARLSGTPAVVYLFDPAGEPRWTSKASVGDVKAPAQCEALTLAMVAEQAQPVLFSGGELVREHYAHLDVRRTIVSLAYVPLLAGETLLGAIEAVSMDRALGASDLEALGEIAELSTGALAAALGYESERNSNFETITRLTAFYDIEKVFHSTLQIDELLPIIASKTREVEPCEAVNVWMIDDDNLVLTARDGNDDSLPLGAPQDAIAARVSDSGESVLIVNPDDPLLAERNAGGTVASLAAVPIIYDDSLVGMMECVNKLDGTPFDEDDVFLLSTIAESAAGALHNASLLEAEKKVEVLETLVEISNEITSTLNLERVLQVVVNSPQRIMPYDRAAVALDERGKLQVKAVSGTTEIVHGDEKIVKLRDMLEFCAVSDTPVSAIGRPEAIEAERPEDRARFREYFTQTGMRSWFSVPLADDQGKLGILVFESGNPDAFGEAQTEFIRIVGGQATVAVRNASLYQEVPLIGVLEPLLKKKHDFMRLDTRRRTAYIVLAVAAVLFLAFVPLPMRVQGNATVAPQSSSKIQAAVDGVVREVYVHEGDRVAKGTVLADMNDWDYRAEVAAAQAKLGQAEAAVNRALANNDGMEAGIQRNEANYWTAEVKRAQERLDHTRLRSPINGVVSTPHIETMVGRKLDEGDTFGEVLNAEHATIDVEVDQNDVRLLHDGDAAAVKLDSFPTSKFEGSVELVSPRSDAVGDERMFFARIDVANPDGLIRPGMQGISKISTGWRPAGYVMFRGLAMWGWEKLWSWFGW